MAFYIPIHRIASPKFSLRPTTHLPPRPRRPPLQRLTEAENQRLLSGERIQKQTSNGRVGSGLVVVDVEAEVATVMAVLSDIDRCVCHWMLLCLSTG